MTAARVRDLRAGEAEWASELMRERRDEYARYSPVFWRPARDATAGHARFLRQQIESTSNVCLRTDSGFIIGQLRNPEAVVDDFAIGTGSWDRDGADLLLAAWERLADGGAQVVRVVTAQADYPKVEFLTGLGLSLVEQWWVKGLEPGAPTAAHGRIRGSGFSGALAFAPPVYDPGGPVLLVDRIDQDADLATIEREAARLGAVLAVLPTPPGGQHELLLRRRDWAVASQWYSGQPVS